MRHAREDYNRIQDPAVNDPSLLGEGCTPIGEDEPVFLLRAKDVIAPSVVREWAYRLSRAGRYQGVEVDRAVQAAMEQARAMEAWQKEHGMKLPDIPAEVAR